MARPPSLHANETPVVLVVDDDLSVRESLGSLFRSVGLSVALFSSATELLESGIPDRPGCLILDVRLPGMNGFNVHDQLVRLNIQIPVIFVTGYGDIPMSVRAMKAGAIDFLPKPLREQDLLDSVHAAIARDTRRMEDKRARAEVDACFASLTPREREVLHHVVEGLMNKQIAHAMGLSEITVKLHRGSLMRKTRSRSLAELVRRAQVSSGATGAMSF